MTLFEENADVQELTACSLDVCNCTLMGPPFGETFCSDDCRERFESSIEGDACGCGHPPCDEAST
jgi:hypothetical protein